MHCAAIGFSPALDLESALAAAARLAADGLAGAAGACAAELAIVAVTSAHGALPPGLEAEVRQVLGSDCRVVGLQVEGLLGETFEVSGSAAVAVVALRGVSADAHLFDHVRGHEAELGEQIEAELGPFEERDLLVLACDAHELDPAALAAGLQQCVPASLLGLGVEGSAGACAAHFADGTIRHGGVLALRLRAARRLELRRAAGARALVERSVTRARGHWCHTIDGEPALEVFRGAAGALSGDPKRAAASVLAFVSGPAPAAGPERAHSIVGFDEESGAIGLSQAVETGDRIRFAIRDGLAARESLSATASALGGAASATPFDLGLATTCRSRGAALFGEQGIESGYLSLAFAGHPWLGLMGSYQLMREGDGPTRLLNLSGVLARLG